MVLKCSGRCNLGLDPSGPNIKKGCKMEYLQKWATGAVAPAILSFKIKMAAASVRIGVAVNAGILGSYTRFRAFDILQEKFIRVSERREICEKMGWVSRRRRSSHLNPVMRPL